MLASSTHLPYNARIYDSKDVKNKETLLGTQIGFLLYQGLF